jgi:MoxR-like ATPase
MQPRRLVKVDDALIDYICGSHATRSSPLIEIGSPRSALALRNCAQARAYLEGRDFTTADDIKTVACAVLAHRVGLARTFDEDTDGIGEGTTVIGDLLGKIPVPL